jgi:curved DNA-binding protein CbpA
VANHYAALGLWLDASEDEIRKTYRRLARLHHPDRNPGDPAAAARFRTVREAYDVLGDPARRTWYDATLRPREPEPEPAPRPLVREEEPADRPSVLSLTALGLGGCAFGLLVAAAAAQWGLYVLDMRGFMFTRLAALVLAFGATLLGKREVRNFHQLRRLHAFGVARLADVPAPSPASRTAASTGRLFARAAPLGFVLLLVAQILHAVQSSGVFAGRL